MTRFSKSGRVMLRTNDLFDIGKLRPRWSLYVHSVPERQDVSHLHERLDGPYPRQEGEDEVKMLLKCHTTRGKAHPGAAAETLCT